MSIFEGLVEVMVKDIVILIFISRNISNIIGCVAIGINVIGRSSDNGSKSRVIS